ncbi:hypothetical protein [Arcobacter arenosus]|jgi:hypothetical protein|uniref:Uncharacterized protein n=1 Tax=Arcobacter arenosus TaxID=2576037 RepID=A0A5R8XY44_9BACT|nr:hypothetical protein [Arcobacter arenosus]TLP35888.1 hypothetical protein FDK22_14655 [Arcobacter arenosus]
MTQEEIQEFKETIAKNIMPLVQNMTEEQIKNTIMNVEKNNPDLPKGFGNMLFEQIMILKFIRKSQQ